ncbi:MAG: hypothetical protein ABW196_08670 [Solirubrobacterales bacterium]
MPEQDPKGRPAASAVQRARHRFERRIDDPTTEREVANSLLHFDRLCGLAEAADLAPAAEAIEDLDGDTARRIVFALAVAGER